MNVEIILVLFLVINSYVWVSKYLFVYLKHLVSLQKDCLKRTPDAKLLQLFYNNMSFAEICLWATYNMYWNYQTLKYQYTRHVNCSSECHLGCASAPQVRFPLCVTIYMHEYVNVILSAWILLPGVYICIYINSYIQ